MCNGPDENCEVLAGRLRGGGGWRSLYYILLPRDDNTIPVDGHTSGFMFVLIPNPAKHSRSYSHRTAKKSRNFRTKRSICIVWGVFRAPAVLQRDGREVEEVSVGWVYYCYAVIAVFLRATNFSYLPILPMQQYTPFLVHNNEIL